MAPAAEIRSNAKETMISENEHIFVVGVRKATSGRQARNVIVTAAKSRRPRTDKVNIEVLLIELTIAGRTTPLRNVSVTDEIAAVRRLFPLTFNFESQRKLRGKMT